MLGDSPSVGKLMVTLGEVCGIFEFWRFRKIPSFLREV